MLNSARCGTHPLNCETSEYANFTANSNVSGKSGSRCAKEGRVEEKGKVGEKREGMGKLNVSQYGQVITTAPKYLMKYFKAVSKRRGRKSQKTVDEVSAARL